MGMRLATIWTEPKLVRIRIAEGLHERDEAPSRVRRHLVLLPEMLGHRLAAWLQGVFALAADDRAFESVYVETKSSEPPL